MDEGEILKQLVVSVMRGDGRDSLSSYGGRELMAMRSAAFLLDEHPDRDCHAFVTSTLERLSRRLARTNRAFDAEYSGMVRGRILWPATFKARQAEDFDPSRYVCRRLDREYDLPENQLLKYLIERIGDCLQSLPETIRRGASLDSDGQLRPLGPKIERMELSIRNFRQLARLRSVPTPPFITEKHLIRADISRIPEYRDAARLGRRYLLLLESRDWSEAASEMASLNLLLPETPDGEGKSWLDFSAALLAIDAAQRNSRAAPAKSPSSPLSTRSAISS